MKFLTKKILFLSLSSLAVIIVLLFYILPTEWCKETSLCNEVYRNDYLGIFIYGAIGIIAATTPFSIVTFFTSEKVFRAWKIFAAFSLPIVLTLSFFVTMSSGGSNFFTMDYSLYFLGIIYGLFFLLSLIVIGISILRNR